MSLRNSGPYGLPKPANEPVVAGIGLTTDISANSTPIVYDTVEYDTHRAYSVITGVYTAPVEGVYRVGVTGYQGGTVNLLLDVNGVNIQYLTVLNANNVQNSSTSVSLKQNDKLSVISAGNTTYVGSTTPGSGYFNYLSIEKIS